MQLQPSVGTRMRCSCFFIIIVFLRSLLNGFTLSYRFMALSRIFYLCLVELKTKIGENLSSVCLCVGEGGGGQNSAYSHFTCAQADAKTHSHERRNGHIH